MVQKTVIRRLGRTIIAGSGLFLLVSAASDPANDPRIIYAFMAGIVSGWVFDALFG